jgi:hypothetical protein
MNDLNESSRSSVVFVVEYSQLPLHELEGFLIVMQKLFINAVLIRITGIVLNYYEPDIHSYKHVPLTK